LSSTLRGGSVATGAQGRAASSGDRRVRLERRPPGVVRRRLPCRPRVVNAVRNGPSGSVSLL